MISLEQLHEKNHLLICFSKFDTNTPTGIINGNFSIDTRNKLTYAVKFRDTEKYFDIVFKNGIEIPLILTFQDIPYIVTLGPNKVIKLRPI